jgi:hypothetical protein
VRVGPAHGHTPNAVRMVVEGEGAWSTVDGEKCPRQRGDLILTPTGLWHEHGHDGHEPVVWLDVLDLPLVHRDNERGKQGFGTLVAVHDEVVRSSCRESAAPQLTVTGMCRGVPGNRRGKRRKRLIHMSVSRLSRATNQGVVGSNPAGRASQIDGLALTRS